VSISSQQNSSPQYKRAAELIQLILVSPNFRQRFTFAEELSYLLGSNAFFGKNFIDKNLAIHSELKEIILNLTRQEEVNQRYESALAFYSWFTDGHSSFTTQMIQWACKSLAELTKYFLSSFTGSGTISTTNTEMTKEDSKKKKNTNDNDDDDDAAATPSKEPKQNAEKVTFSTTIGTDFKQDIVYPVWSAADREKTIGDLSNVYGQLAIKASDRADSATLNVSRSNAMDIQERRANLFLGGVRTFHELFKMPWERARNDREEQKALEDQQNNSRDYEQKIADLENLLNEALEKLDRYRNASGHPSQADAHASRAAEDQQNQLQRDLLNALNRIEGLESELALAMSLVEKQPRTARALAEEIANLQSALTRTQQNLTNADEAYAAVSQELSRCNEEREQLDRARRAAEENAEQARAQQRVANQQVINMQNHARQQAAQEQQRLAQQQAAQQAAIAQNQARQQSYRRNGGRCKR